MFQSTTASSAIAADDDALDLLPPTNTTTSRHTSLERHHSLPFRTSTSTSTSHAPYSADSRNKRKAVDEEEHTEVSGYHEISYDIYVTGSLTRHVMMFMS